MKLFFLVLLALASGIWVQAQSATTDSVYQPNQTDKEADFEGGNTGWIRYLTRNLTYPPRAMNNRITGTVIVQFVVDEKGRPGNITALSGPEVLQKEGIRLIKNSPRWIAATQNGEKVRSWKRQSIIFRLE